MLVQVGIPVKHVTPAFVQACANGAVTNKIGCTLSNATAGNVVAFFVYWNSEVATLSGVTACGTPAVLLDNPYIGMGSSAQGYAVVPSSGNCTVTSTISSGTSLIMTVQEISGVDTASPIDNNVHGILYPGGGSYPNGAQSPTFTTTRNGDYIFSGIINNGGNSVSYTAGTYSLNYTYPAAAAGDDGSGRNMASEYTIQPSAGPVAAAWTPNSGAFFSVGIMAFQPANTDLSGLPAQATIAESLSLTVAGLGTTASFPTTGILDNFNRAGEMPLGNGNWSGPTRPGNAQLKTDGDAVLSSGGNADSYWSFSAFGPNSEAYVTVTGKSPDNNYCIGVACKITNPNSASFNAYQGEICVGAGTDLWTIYKVSNNSFSALSMSGSDVEVNAGDGIGLECTPNSQKLKRKSGGTWSDVKTSTDSSYNNVSGYIGLHMEYGWTGDDFGGGTVVPACTADDGATVNQISTTGTSVPFGTVSANTFYQGCQDLKVSTNAPGGYSLSVQESYAMRTASGGYTIPDTTCDAGGCTETVAASWTDPNKNGYGHTCYNQSMHDCDSSYVNGPNSVNSQACRTATQRSPSWRVPLQRSRPDASSTGFPCRLRRRRELIRR